MARVEFREDRCKGCGLCISVCPKKIVRLKPEQLNEKGFHPAGVDQQDLCTGCTFCAVICPDNVIEVFR
jgi:2-oxoglutarate ferredoxin oxidoreductase subunit delta